MNSSVISSARLMLCFLKKAEKASPLPSCLSSDKSDNGAEEMSFEPPGEPVSIGVALRLLFCRRQMKVATRASAATTADGN